MNDSVGALGVDPDLEHLTHEKEPITTNETWRPTHVRGYEVSSLGRVRSSKRPHQGVLILKPSPDKNGYPNVSLVCHGKTTTHKVHRLVAAAFHGPCPEGQQVRHLDGSKTNGRADNLAYGSPKQNSADRFLHGTHRRGKQIPSAVLTEWQVLDIRAAYASGALQRELMIRHGVSRALISCIVNRKLWAYL